MNAAAALLALDAACETWGRRRHTAPEADLLGPEALVGCAIEVLGLADLIPEHEPRAFLLDVAGVNPPLRDALGFEAIIVLNAAIATDRSGHQWSHSVRKAREAAADLAVMDEAARADLAPVRSEHVRLPDSVQVVTLRRPRADDKPPCMAESPAVQLLGGIAVSFGCGDVAEHPSENHAWVITW